MKARPFTYRHVDVVIVATEAETGLWIWGYKFDSHGLRYNDLPCATEQKAFEAAKSAAEKAVDAMLKDGALGNRRMLVGAEWKTGT